MIILYILGYVLLSIVVGRLFWVIDAKKCADCGGDRNNDVDCGCQVTAMGLVVLWPVVLLGCSIAAPIYAIYRLITMPVKK